VFAAFVDGNEINGLFVVPVAYLGGDFAGDVHVLACYIFVMALALLYLLVGPIGLCGGTIDPFNGLCESVKE
jgi:hypothetical protein